MANGHCGGHDDGSAGDCMGSKLMNIEAAISLLFREVASLSATVARLENTDGEYKCASCGAVLGAGAGYLWPDGVWTCKTCLHPGRGDEAV